MANRYLRATGNWTDPVWAATSDGVAGSAATPTFSDTVYISANYTATINTYVVVSSIYHTNGSINVLWSGNFTIRNRFVSSGSSARSINLGAATMQLFLGQEFDQPSFSLSGSGLTFAADNSRIHIDTVFHVRALEMGGYSYGDLIVDMSATNETLTIAGSPTFRSLIIQSKNSAEHTVNFDSGATITTNKFIAIGSSSSKKLTVKPLSGSSAIALSSGGSSYGQFVDMQASASGAGVPKYIGVNSIQSSGMGWLLQDPPKISTLVDHFDTLNTATWNTVTAGTGNVSVSGGKLNMSWFGGSSSFVGITTKDTYDLINETAYIKVDSNALGLWLTVWPVYQGSDTSIWAATEVTFDERFYRISATSAGVVTIDKYDGSWTNLTTETVSPEQLRSVRLDISGSRDMSDGEMVIDSVGVGPYLAPSNPGAFLQFFGGL